MLIAVVLLLVLLGIALAFAVRAGRPTAPALPVRSWTASVSDDFDGLSEAERCDLIFAVAAVDNGSSAQLLARALEDPSEAVALAAAHALVRRGGEAALDRYLEAIPAGRARSLRLLVEIFD